MLLSVCGTMSPISQATRELISLIATETIGAPTQIYAVTVEQLRDAWKSISQEKRKSVLLYSDAPQTNLIQLIIDSDIPTVISVDDFEEIFAFNVVNTGKDILAALRQSTHTAVQISQLINTSRNLILGPDRYDTSVIDLAQDIMHFFSIEPSDQQLEKLRTKLGDTTTLRDFMAATFPQWQPTTDFRESLPREDQDALESVIHGYDPLTRRRPFEVVHWSPRWFQDGDAPDRQLTGPKLLAGPARTIFFGPYIYLPVGQWDCEVHVEFNDCRSDTMALLDIFNGSVLAAVTMRLPRHGIYAIDISFQNQKPDAHLEFRLQILKGAIEGELRLLGVKVKRAAPVEAEENLRLTHAPH